IQDALAYTQNIINTVHDPVIILYGDLKVALASRAFYQTFREESKETEGRFIYDLGNRQWNIPKLRQLLEEILPNTTSFDHFEIEHDFPRIGKRTVLLNACRIYMEGNSAKLIMLTIKDITDEKKIEELQKRITGLEEELKRNS
nr:PAS domain-containing protein [Candidatus Omnitrophota bacterium]